MSALITSIGTWFKGTKVGEDRFGNRYYRQRGGKKRKAGLRRQKRWVLYRGTPEATKVPPEWHAWLHYTVNDTPEVEGPLYDWQKDHLPNLTGTDLAYRPPGHSLSERPRAKTGSDYEAWSPK